MALLAIVLPTPIRGQVGFPDELADLFVGDCDSELSDAIQCIVGTLCFDIYDVLDVATFPDFGDVIDCIDLEEPLCPIVNACPRCTLEVETLFLCQFLSSESSVGNATEIAADCSPLVC
jgi:hypothetical protein